MKPETFTTKDGFKITVTVQKPETKPNGDWEPETGDAVHILSGSGLVFSSVWNGGSGQQSSLAMGNVFPTKELAQKKKDYIIALNKVTKAIKKKNNGWVPDWSDKGEYKYFPYHGGGWGVTEFVFHLFAISYPYCKTREIAEQIIDEHQTELDIIRLYQF